MPTTHYMAQEARTAPHMLLSEAARWQRKAAGIRRLVAKRPQVVLVGRGSSGNVCTFAAYLFALQTGHQPIEFRPWLTTQPLPDADWSDAVVYAFSSSGRSTDVAASAEWLRRHGALAIAISEADTKDACVLQSAQHIVRLGCGPELAVPATKSVIAQLFIAAALAGYDIEEEAAQLAECMVRVDAAGVPAKLAAFLTGARTVTWLARGPSVAGALDAALKLQEAVSIPAFGYSTAEYLHGPIAAAGPQDRVVFFAADDEFTDNQQAVITILVARGVPFICLGYRQPPGAHLTVPFPAARWSRTALLAFIAQLTSVALAEHYGINPDEHPALHKVTETR